MKAIRVEQFGGPEALKWQDVPDLQPEAGQVVVRIGAAGVNPVETYVRAGKYARLPQLPYTPGSDGAGAVETVGADVNDVKPGDRVYLFGSVSGAYAEYALCERTQVYPLADSLSFAQGAAIGVPYGTAWRALFTRGQAQAGETVLVHGATGGVGIAAIQIARAAGLTVIGTAGSEAGRQLALAQGAAHVLPHEQGSDPEHIKALTDGKGVNLILEMLANVNLNNDFKVCAPHGRVVIIGSRGTVEIDPRLTMTTELDIRGMTLMAATPHELADMHRELGKGFADGTLRPIIQQEFPFTEAAHAHELVMQNNSGGKIVLTP